MLRARLVVVLSLVLPIPGGFLVDTSAQTPAGNPREVEPERRPTGVKVVLVGIDGATFKVIDPLLAQGRLPEFRKLMETGSRGILKSLPKMVSPSIWTTIATGRDPKEHGITDFVVGKRYGPSATPRQLVSSKDRRSLALWNISGAFGRKVGFVGWWATWPAEPVFGWMVSDRMTRSRFTEFYGSTGDEVRTFPKTLAESLAPLVCDPDALPMAEIRDLIDLTPDEARQLEATKGVVFGYGMTSLRYGYCEQRTYEEIALRLLAGEQPDLTGILLVMTDPISHSFWHLYEPDRYEGVDRDAARRQGSVIPKTYEHNDRYLARLPHFDRNTVVMVVSDHGFRASGVLPQERPAGEAIAQWFDQEKAKSVGEGTVAVGQPGEHHPDGIFLAAGGPIRKGVSVQASVFDVAPTVLALLGLPIAEDFKGRVLTEIIDPGFLANHPIRKIPSYEPLISRTPVSGTMSPEEESQKLELLRSLGYIR